MEDEEAAKLFGGRVKRKRMMVGLSQRQLADSIGVPPTHVSRLEGGYILTVGIGELLRLINVLKTSPDYLLGLSSDPGEIPEEIRHSESVLTAK
jgi:transcriptional regulator with XRE-family HTH domain